MIRVIRSIKCWYLWKFHRKHMFQKFVKALEKPLSKAIFTQKNMDDFQEYLKINYPQ